MLSPSLTERTSGPTSATLPHTQRLGAEMAVAGISSPPRVFRSPSSGWSTTIRSPVRRTCVFGWRLFRGLDAAAVFTITPILARGSPLTHPKYDARP